MGQQGRESSVESGLQGGGSGLGWSEGRLLPAPSANGVGPPCWRRGGSGRWGRSLEAEAGVGGFPGVSETPMKWGKQ